MGYPSISGIPNNKYEPAFVDWLFGGLNGVKAVVQLGLDNGYLSSLFVLRTMFSHFNYLGVGSGTQLPEQMVVDGELFLLTDKLNKVEIVSRVAMFTITTPGQLVMVCEEMEYGPLFYYPLLRPGDILITYGWAGNLDNGSNIVGVDKWKMYVK